MDRTGVCVMKNGSGVEAGCLGAWTDVATGSGIYEVHTSGLKRTADLAIAIPMLILVVPLMAVIYALLKVFDPGPVIYTHLRVGKDGRIFVIYKFRTMRVDAADRLEKLLQSDPVAAEEWTKFQKLSNDRRVTVLGRILRKFSFDELPQLFNILRGDMSVVGPRPVSSSEIYRYGSNYVYYTAVRPGVVGLWQVSGRHRLTYPERVALDVQYVKTWSIWADVVILLRAIPVVLLGSGV